jgi:DAK2 domain fusion protein YloV
MDAASMARAFAMARDTAYKGVVRPVEGTILTVAKDAASACDKAAAQTEDIVEVISQMVLAMDRSVQSTPDLLPVLREAGVVDSGGKGLFFILEGMLRHLQGLSLDTAVTTVRPLAALDLDNSIEAIEPGQDYEVVIDFRPSRPLNLEDFYNNLQQMGTSIQVGEGDGLYRMHIHVPTEKRYEPIDYTMSLGTITKVAIENLIAQMEAIERLSGRSKLTLAPVEPGQIAVIAVAPGPGIARVFASLGAAAIVEGGQTMNPSTQEIINSFENLPTDKIIILPNNKNIILAAKTATELTVKKVVIIPSLSVPQGLSAMLRLAPEGDLDVVAKEMTKALEDVETGEITIATRSVEIDGVTVQEGNVIALHNGKLVLSCTTIEDAVIKLLEKAHADHYELITMFSGADLPKRETDRIADIVRSLYPEQELEVQEGGQPHYPIILAIE